MRRNRKKVRMAAVAVLASALAFSSSALAAPADELNAILERQKELQQESFPEQQLGLSELGKAICENGLYFSTRAEIGRDTAEFFELTEEIPEGGYVSTELRIDPKGKKWQLGAGAGTLSGTDDVSVLDFSLYGDEQQLALSLPQLYDGALALRAGNFKEQYLNSALAQILEAEASSVPDLNLHFYPDDALLEAVSGPFESFREELEQKGSELEEKVQVEKTEDGETTIYTARMATEDLTDFYRLIFEAYLSVFTDSGLMEGSVTEEELETRINQVMDVIPMVTGDEVLVNFTVQDNLLQKIDYEVRIDTTVLEQQETIPETQPSVAETAAAVEEEETVVTELVEETLAPAGDVADAAGAQRPDEEHLRNQTQHTEAEENGQEMVVEAGPFIGTCSCEIVFTDPENLMQDFAYRMTITSEDGSEFASMEVKKETKASFDSSTGDFDAFLTMRADDGVEVILGLESTFRDVEKGKSFCWCLDELYVEAGVQRVTASAEITVSADPGTFDAPEKERFLLDLTQGGLLDLVNEITANAEAWSAQFEPETDTDTAVRTAVIGGADGPTSVFIAGKTAN